MNKDVEYVVFPCDKPSWPQIRSLLEDLKDIAQNGNHDLKRLATFHQRIVDINEGFDEPQETKFSDTEFHGLVNFLQKNASAEEQHIFLQSTLPVIINLVLELPSVKPAEGLIISSQQNGGETELNRNFVASILACAFLCLFEDRGKPWKSGHSLNVINFTSFFTHLPSPPQSAKLRCVLNYFERIANRRFNILGNIRFIRQVIAVEELPTLDVWLNCDVDLCPLVVHHEGRIEDAGCDAIEVDFANRYIGGGVIGRGRVQEEIRFCVCPELMASMLFMEMMDDNEAIIIQGYEQFSNTEGYAGSLKYAGDHQDPAMYDEAGNLLNTLCAVDAVSYRSNSDKQYLDDYCLRDLNKAYVGFSANICKGKTGLPTDNQSDLVLDFNQSGERLHSNTHCDRLLSNSDEEEYHTASESETERDDQYVPSSISNLADGLLVDILATALLEASSILSKQSHGRSPKLKRNMTPDHDTISNWYSSSGSKNSSFENMDHLDVDLRDWVSKFRRRSSNLSDIGSRRSSCSTRYSSDFSSELEEYYENFQKREQPFIHHTITEETGNHLINEFASSLASRLLQESTNVAIQSQPTKVQDFCDTAPEEVLTKPKPRKLSDEEESDVPEVSQEVAERFAESLLSKLFVFSNEFNSSDNDSISCSKEKSIPFKSVSEQSYPNSSANNSDSRPNHDYDQARPDVCENVETQASWAQKPDSDNFVQKDTAEAVDLKSKAMKIVQFAITGAYQKMTNIPNTSGAVSTDQEESTPLKSDPTYLSPTFMTEESDSVSSSSHGKCDNVMTASLDKNITPNLSGEEMKRLDNTGDSSRPGSTSPSRKNVQFHKDIIQSDEGRTSLNFDSWDDGYFETSNLHNLTSLSDSSTSLESAGHIKIIPRVLVTDEINSEEDMIEEMYGRIAEKLIVTGVSSALKEVQTTSGNSYEGSCLTFSSTKSQPEHSVYVHGGNLIYPGEILRGDSFEDVNKPKEVNYFANSLSRDLLTNAFVEVQRNVNGGNYFRRSSEPLKISNQAARQLMENTKNGIHGFFSDRIKSRTQEDIGTFAEELARRGSFDDFRHLKARWSCGFRDPTLSRFAEELMKTECKVPELRLLDSSTESLSGSSTTSFLSSKSGFQDPVLSSFEEELLCSSYRRSSSRGSYKRKSRKSGILSKQRNSGPECFHHENQNQSADKNKRGMSFDSEMSAVSWRSFRSSQSFEEVSDFAEKLSESIIKESFKAVFRDFVLPSDRYKSRSKPPVIRDVVTNFADGLLSDIMVHALQCIKDEEKKSKRKSGTSSESSSATEALSVSDEFSDALCIPYSKLEDFADKIAKSVMQTSVGFLKREVDCMKKKLHGRPIATGNWGCGAYRGDPHLKSMIQWMAASYAGAPFMLYYSFQHEDLVQLQDVVDTVICRGWKVGQLMQAVRTYNMACQDWTSDIQPNLFQLLLDQNSFRDIT